MSRRARFDKLYTVDTASGGVGVSVAGSYALTPQPRRQQLQQLQSHDQPQFAAAHGTSATAAVASPSIASAGVAAHGLRSPPNHSTRVRADIPFSDFVDPATGAIALGALRNEMVADSAAFLSAVAWGDAVLDRVHSETTGLTRPDSVTSGAALVVLDVVARNCTGSAAPLLLRVKQQLEHAVFQCRAYDANQAYFDLYRASLAARLLDARRPQEAVARALMRCNRDTLRCAFVSWRGLARRATAARLRTARQNQPHAAALAFRCVVRAHEGRVPRAVVGCGQDAAGPSVGAARGEAGEGAPELPGFLSAAGRRQSDLGRAAGVLH